MNNEIELKKNNSGIHLMSRGNSEYTICGDAQDGDEMVGGKQKSMIDLKGFQKVTCKKCKIEIANILNYIRKLNRATPARKIRKKARP